MLNGIIIDNAIEFNFGQLHERKNKSAEIFRQYYTSGFGEISPQRKFPAIRYYSHGPRVNAYYRDSTIGLGGLIKIGSHDNFVHLMLT